MPRKRRSKPLVVSKRKKQKGELDKNSSSSGTPENASGKSRKGFFYEIYDKHYKVLFVIPMLMLVLALASIGFKMATTGDFINRGVSLKGGVTLTVITGHESDAAKLQEFLLDKFPGEDIVARSIQRSGQPVGVLVEAGIDGNNDEEVNRLLDSVAEWLGTSRGKLEYSIEIMGSALGASFFRQTFRAIIIAFLFMALVVWYYFRIPVPSLAVILAAFSDMVVTLAAVNMLGIRLSTAGIAAFLMLIGYSVDTDILLSTRVLKRGGGSVLDRTINAMKTGLTMNMTTLAAVVVALVFSESEVLKQIMTILLIGLLADIINTWIQNAGILRWYLEKHKVELKTLD